MKHHPQLIGVRVHVYDTAWQDGLPRAGFVDGFSADPGMFSVTVEHSNADMRSGRAPRTYLRRVLLVHDLADKPIGVDCVAVIQAGQIVNLSLPRHTTEQLSDRVIKDGQLATADHGAKRPDFVDRKPEPELPEYTDDDEPEEPEEPEDDEIEEEEEETQPPPKTTSKKAGKKAGKKTSKKAGKKTATKKTASAESPPPAARLPEPMPPGVRPGEDFEPPNFGGAQQAGIVGGSDNAPAVGATVGDEEPAQPPPTQETRSPIEQLTASPTWKVIRELEEAKTVSVQRTGMKELSIMLPSEEKAVAKVLWISAKPGRPDKPIQPHGFTIKIRDRGGRCSITLSEHERQPAELQRSLSRLARAVAAAAKAKPNDWGSTHANMQAALAA